MLAREDLAGILTYHALAGTVLAGDIADGESTPDSVAGPALTINKTDAGVTVNGANVVIADIVGTNGVVHVIDAVLLPPVPADAPTE